MSFDFSNELPIYLQIVEHIKMKIISKQYLPNQKIPSVRDLSVMYMVNPNTVQKALQELEMMGIVYTERTNGKYVTNNVQIIEDASKQTISEHIDKFYNWLSQNGLNSKDVIENLNKREWF